MSSLPASPALPLLGAHSWYSLLDGARSPGDLARRGAELGWSSLALADENNLYALPELVDEARAAGLKPLAAASVAVEGRPAFRAYCLDRRGFSRLCAILSRALAAARGGAPAGRSRASSPSGAGSYDPVADLLAGGWEGLALASSDPGLLAALAPAGGRLYAALAPRSSQAGLAAAAASLGLPLLAELHARFVEPGDAGRWRLARAVDERRSLAALEREGRPEPPGALLLPAARVRALLSAFPAALANAADLAEEAAEAGSFFAEAPVFPAYRGLEEGESFRLLRRLCEEGASRRYPGPGPGALRARLERELGIIRAKGFSSYFLVVRDIVLRCPRSCGRGSAASSLVSYLLGLTHVDPLEHDLFFERFLNEGRRDPPDIDIDFPWDERPALLASVLEDYAGRAAMVAEHCRFSDRGALREAGIALGRGEEELARSRRALRLGGAGRGPGLPAGGPPEAGREAAGEAGEGDGSWAEEGSALPPELLELARSIRDMPRYIGTHCGGLVITPGPITGYSHVQGSPAGLPVLAWEKEGTERAGLVKIDLLGNRSLAVLRDCIELANRERAGEGGEGAPPLAWDFAGAAEDPAARKLVESGRTMGVFYIESPATRQLLVKMGVADYRRLVAASSIIRPAANKYIGEYVRRLRGGTWRRLPEAVESVLEETHGIMVYQEDVSRVAMAAAGFSAAEADGLRKALTKKRRGIVLESFQGRFLAGCAASGLSRRDAAELWDMVLSFDGYSFCKAHSASYALVSYRLAWMKAHYPAIFMASVINNGGGYYGVQAYLGEARRLGLELLPPSVNESDFAYRVEPHPERAAQDSCRCAASANPERAAQDSCRCAASANPERAALRVGLCQVSGLSRPTAERLLAARGEGGRFASLEDFYRRAGPSLVEARALARSGCLDGLPARAGGEPLTRPQALWALHRLRSRAAAAGGRRGPAPRGARPAAPAEAPELIPDDWEPPAAVGDYGSARRLADEAAVLGLLLSRPPASLFSARAELVARRRGLPPLAGSASLPGLEGSRASLAGVVIAAKEVLDRQGRPMAFYSFEDEEGLFEAVLFPQAYARGLPTLEGNSALLVVGTIECDYGVPSIHAEEVFGLNRPDRD